jgi:hypothetical protein
MHTQPPLSSLVEDHSLGEERCSCSVVQDTWHSPTMRCRRGGCSASNAYRNTYTRPLLKPRPWSMEIPHSL